MSPSVALVQRALTVDGNLASRVFHVSSGVTATIAGLTITNGTGWEID